MVTVEPIRKIPPGTWYLLAVIYASLFLAVLGNMLYTNHVADVNNRKWCGLLGAYHDAYANNPEPPTQLGKDIKAQLEARYVDFRCESVRKP